MELTIAMAELAIYDRNCVIPVLIVSKRAAEILLGRPRFCTALFIEVMFMVELSAAACCNEPKLDSIIIINWLKVTYNNKIMGMASNIIPRNTDKVSFLAMGLIFFGYKTDIVS